MLILPLFAFRLPPGPPLLALPPRDIDIDIMSSLSGDGERAWSARPLIFMPRCPPEGPLGGGPPRLGFTTELMFVIKLGSIPRTVNDDDRNGRAREGQSPIKWRLLVQWAQDTDTRTGAAVVSCRGNFHKKSQSNSRCSEEPHKSHGISEAELFKADGHCFWSCPRSRHR